MNNNPKTMVTYNKNLVFIATINFFPNLRKLILYQELFHIFRENCERYVKYAKEFMKYKDTR